MKVSMARGHGRDRAELATAMTVGAPASDPTEADREWFEHRLGHSPSPYESREFERGFRETVDDMKCEVSNVGLKRMRDTFEVMSTWPGPKRKRFVHEMLRTFPELSRKAFHQMAVARSAAMKSVPDCVGQRVYDQACEWNGITQTDRDLARVIKDARKAKGMTQFDLAVAMKVSRALVSHWEAGRQPVPEGSVEDLAEVLDLDPLAIHLWCGRIPKINDEDYQTVAQTHIEDLVTFLKSRLPEGGDSDA